MRYLSQTATQTVIPALGETAETHEEIASTLQQTFFPQPPPAYLQDLNQAKYPAPVDYKSTITIGQVQRAVHKLAPNKAPGPDEITNKVLQQALLTIEIWLQKILQAGLNLGYFPQVFKETTTIVLRKPSKPDYTKAKAYRPIALESTMSTLRTQPGDSGTPSARMRQTLGSKEWTTQ